KLNGLGMSGPGNPCRTMTSPWTLPSIGSPAYFASAGLGSKVSTWLQPPPMNSEMTAVARGLKWGGFGAYGFTPTAAASQPSRPPCTCWSADNRPCRSSKYASARPLMPPPERKRNSRRSQKFLVQRCDMRLPQVEELVEVQDDVRERDEGLLRDQVHADRRFGVGRR